MNKVVKHTKEKSPLALFDAVEYIKKQSLPAYLTTNQKKDFTLAIGFLQCYLGSQSTFNSYRREIERLLHWTWHIAKKTLKDLRREHIETFIRFCQKPPKS